MVLLMHGLKVASPSPSPSPLVSTTDDIFAAMFRIADDKDFSANFVSNFEPWNWIGLPLTKTFLICNITYDTTCGSCGRKTTEDCRLEMIPGLAQSFEIAVVKAKARALVEWNEPGRGATLRDSLAVFFGFPIFSAVLAFLPLHWLFDTPIPVAGSFIYLDPITNQTRVVATSGLWPYEDVLFCKEALDAAAITPLPLPPQKSLLELVQLSTNPCFGCE